MNEHGNTPLHYACFWNYESVAEVGKLYLICIDPSFIDFLYFVHISTFGEAQRGSKSD